MILNVNKNSFFIFDLDDTLYPEIAYLESGYKYIAARLESIIGDNIYYEMLKRYHSKENVFQWISLMYSDFDVNISTSNLLKLYREHIPAITLNEEADHLLKILKDIQIESGLITDGRSTTQRNKIKALGLEGYFKDLIISEEFGSEKPDERNYLFFQNKYQGRDFIIIADNPAKDFLVPKKLGWMTICLKDNGSNIHAQSFDSHPSPDFIVNSLKELILNNKDIKE